MANIRQYIGARYTIKIYENSQDAGSAEWEANVTYEPLVMVTYNNSSYLSKKDVPATIGNPAQNPTYWIVTGAYNGQIAALQAQIDAINNNELPAITSQIQSLSDRIDAISNKKILVIGNSYVYFGVARKIEALFDAYYEKYESATGFITYADRTKTFVTELDDAIADDDIPKDEITDILFVSAMGDTRAYTENSSTFSANVLTAMESIQNKVTANFPNCKNVMLTLAETRDIAYFTGENANKYSALFQVHKIFKNLCFTRSINYIGWSGFNALFNSDFVQSDHYHPSDAGNDVIGEWIKNAYLGHQEYKALIARAPISCNYVSGATIITHVELMPDICNIRLGNFSATSGSAVAITASSVLIDTNDLAVPAPAPTPGFSVGVKVYRASSGASDNELFIGVESDSNGVVVFNNYFAPQNATTGATTLSFTGLTNISYIP